MIPQSITAKTLTHSRSVSSWNSRCPSSLPGAKLRLLLAASTPSPPDIPSDSVRRTVLARISHRLGGGQGKKIPSVTVRSRRRTPPQSDASPCRSAGNCRIGFFQGARIGFAQLLDQTILKGAKRAFHAPVGLWRTCFDQLDRQFIHQPPK